jgi:hypothetical protein
MCSYVIDLSSIQDSSARARALSQSFIDCSFFDGSLSINAYFESFKCTEARLGSVLHRINGNAAVDVDAN